MRINRLDISGFKSFPDRVQIPFPPGISAVVGPNGCGKSNIIDAIRWVMGEQSARQLRGRQMDDVLFNGARSRQAVGLAEVTMVLANETSKIGSGIGPSEIAITRRLFRSGDSEYLINKVPCRLKDVTQFLMDTGLGAKAYAIIEQGRIGWLVDARPEERRILIDEAAGITRYKAQKKEAERRIEATMQNLENVKAVMAETKRQVNNLTRAARKAEEYREFKSQAKNLDVFLTLSDLSDLTTRQNDMNGRKDQRETELLSLLADLERMEVELERVRLDIVEREKEADAVAAAFFELQSQFERLNQEESFLVRETREKQVRQEKLTGDLERLAEQKEAKAVEMFRLQEEAASMEEDARAKQAELSNFRAEYTDLKEDYDHSVEKRDGLGQALAEIRSRLNRIEATLSGHDRLVQNIEEQHGILGAELFRLTDEIGSVETELDSHRQKKSELVGRLDELRSESEVINEDLAGRRSREKTLAVGLKETEAELTRVNSRLVALQEVKNRFAWYPEGVKALMTASELKDAGLIGPLAEHLDVPTGYEAALEAALGERLQYVLVTDKNAALQALNFLKAKNLGRCGFVSRADMGKADGRDLLQSLVGEFVTAGDALEARTLSENTSVVTSEGDYFSREGLVVGGKPKKAGNSLLASLKEIEDLSRQAKALDDRRKEQSLLWQDAVADIEELTERMGEFDRLIRAVESERVEADKQVSIAASRMDQLERRRVEAEKNLKAKAEQIGRLENEKETALVERDRMALDGEDLERRFKEAEERVRVLASALEDARERGQKTTTEAGTLDERLRNIRKEAERIREWQADLESQIRGRNQESAETAEELIRIQARRKALAEALMGFDERLAEAEQAVSEKKREVDALRTDLNSREHSARQARRKRSELDESIRDLDLKLQEIQFRKQSHLERMQREYQLDMENLPDAERPVIDSSLTMEESRQQLNVIRSKIEAMGEVNLTAIGEHDALLERYNFYQDQYDDLNKAVEDLQNSITRINRTCKVRFTSTFQAVDQKLREIFPLLFEGGEGWLSLTDESRILDSGVEIHVHPPGKRLTVMSLLSGGEKALVALSLIFALYLIKPSPFCLLDETDAPLDEANIDRFNRLLTKLGQSSQIVMVTHNKRTMQISESLYGVTMEEPGISKLVSVNLSEIEDFQQHAEMVQAG